jgi:hypothetical protein
MLLRVAQRYLEDGTRITSDDALLDVAVTLPLLTWTDAITDGRNLSRTFGLAAVASQLAPERF